MENVGSFEFYDGKSKKFWVIIWEERSIRI